MRDQYIRAGEGFFIVYSITQRQSFESLKNLKKKIFQVKEEKDSPVVIVGNKCDLEADREVLTQEGKEFAKSFYTTGRAAPFLEASAKERINIDGTQKYKKKNTKQPK